MTSRPWHSCGQVTLLLGDARDHLAQMPGASADCVVTSPPYYRLRDYGVPGQYGLEDTPDAYIARLRAVFREARRVLAADGTLWLNLGDCYVSGPTGPRRSSGLAGRPNALTTPHGSGGRNGGGRPAKSLLGMPWRVAFALQDDGWLLRSCVIWHKPNAMPESVRDRPAARHEYLFLFARQARYWFDLDPIRVPLKRPEALPRGNLASGGARQGGHGGIGATARRRGHSIYGAKYDASPGVWAGGPPGANMRPTGEHHGAASMRGANPGTVRTIPTRPLREAHFAPFPVDLPLRAIAAGCPPARCATCSAPTPAGTGPAQRLSQAMTGHRGCVHPTVRPCVVLDPFSGAGTTGLAALQLGRAYVGIDINPAYHDLARQRLACLPDARSDQGAAA